MMCILNRLNGHRVLLYYRECIDENGLKKGPGCDTNKHEIIMEVKKNNATYVVEIQQDTPDLNQEAFRIAQSVK